MDTEHFYMQPIVITKGVLIFFMFSTVALTFQTNIITYAYLIFVGSLIYVTARVIVTRWWIKRRIKEMDQRHPWID